MTLTLYVDGGTKGSVICLVDDSNGYIVVKKKRISTNNELEYFAVIFGIEYAKKHYLRKNVTINSDSKLIVNQINGKWNINMDTLLILNKRALRKLKDNIKIKWIPREKNLAGIHLEELMK